MTETAYPTELTNQEVNLTAAAHAKMRELMTDTDDDDIEAIRVFVAGGGCGGMTYGMTFTNARSEYDSVLEQDGVKIYVDAVALNYLKGVEIDFVQQGMGASFVFNNVFQATGGSGACSACGAAGGGCA
jgi:iron-sulfur cluster insertion protein